MCLLLVCKKPKDNLRNLSLIRRDTGISLSPLYYGIQSLYLWGKAEKGITKKTYQIDHIPQLNQTSGNLILLESKGILNIAKKIHILLNFKPKLDQ